MPKRLVCEKKGIFLKILDNQASSYITKKHEQLRGLRLTEAVVNQKKPSKHPVVLINYLVDFDTGDNALLDKHINNLLAINSGLVECLLKEDSTRDVLTQTWSRHQEGTVSLAVSLGVL